MHSRREFLAGSTVLLCPVLAGCMGANEDVVEPYTEGYESFQQANDDVNAGRLREGRDKYVVAEDRFAAAREAAGDDTVADYCEESRALADIRARQTQREMEDSGGEDAEQSDGDSDGLEFSRSEPQNDENYRSEEEWEAMQYRMRSPDTIEEASSSWP